MRTLRILGAEYCRCVRLKDEQKWDGERQDEQDGAVAFLTLEPFRTLARLASLKTSIGLNKKACSIEAAIQPITLIQNALGASGRLYRRAFQGHRN